MQSAFLAKFVHLHPIALEKVGLRLHSSPLLYIYSKSDTLIICYYIII